MTALVGLVIVVALPSCGKSFEAPCHVVARSSIDPSEPPAVRVGPLALSEGRDGETIVVSFEQGESSDAAAPDGGAEDGGAEDGGVSSFVPPRVRVLVLGPDGERRGTQAFAPPSALVARRGSTGAVGASFTGDGALFHWEERAFATAPDGTPTAAIRIVLQRRAQDGSESPAVADPELACTRCALEASFATASGTTAAIVTTLAEGAPASAARRTRLLAFNAAGQKIGAVDLSGLAPANAATGGPAAGGLGGLVSLPIRLTVQRGLLLARVGTRAALFDPTLEPRGGPYDLPTNETELDVDPATGRVALVYSAAATGDGAPFPVGRFPDLVYEARVPTSARPIASRRVSASSTAIDLRRSGARTGIVHLAGTELFFSIVDDSGTKLGGDHPLTPAAAGVSVSAGLGAADTFDQDVARTLLTTPDATRFVYVSAANDVVREVIACE